MFKISKQFTFEAAHQLPNHDGKCKRLHGHSWRGRVTCAGADLQTDGPKAGMLIDYGDISAVLKPIVDEYLDHQFLNESLPLENPTSEAIAEWLYNKIKFDFPNLLEVEIEETCTSRAQYRIMIYG